MDADSVKDYYSQADVVQHYRDAALDVGLWQSEEKIFCQYFSQQDTLLDLGTGAGRIAIGLYELGYPHVIGLDNSSPMVAAARNLSRRLEYAIAFQTGDAAALPFGEALFEGVIFGFSGLMQIPTTAQRRHILAEIYQVLKPGGYFIFTLQDRELPAHQACWQEDMDRLQKQRGWIPPEYGDILLDTPYGEVYLHIPTIEQTQALLIQVGFRVAFTGLRSTLAEESPQVCAFADECRFWVAQRPE